MAANLPYEESVLKLAHCLSNEDKQWLLNVFQLPRQYKGVPAVSIFKALEMIGMYSTDRPEGLAVLPRWLQNKSLEKKIRKKLKTKRDDSFRPTPNEELYSSADLKQCFLFIEEQARTLNAHLELVKKIIEAKNKTSDDGLKRAGGVSQLENASRNVEAMLDCLKEATTDNEYIYSSYLVTRPLPQPPPGSAPPTRHPFLAQALSYDPEEVYDDFLLPTQGVSLISHEAQITRSHSFDAGECCDTARNYPLSVSQRNVTHRGMQEDAVMQASGVSPTSLACSQLRRRPLPNPSTSGSASAGHNGGWHRQEGDSPFQTVHHQTTYHFQQQDTDPTLNSDETDDNYYNKDTIISLQTSKRPALPPKPHLQKEPVVSLPHKSSSAPSSPVLRQQEFFNGRPSARKVGKPTPPITSSVQKTASSFSGGSAALAGESAPQSLLSHSPLFNKQKKQIDEDYQQATDTGRGQRGGTYGVPKPKIPILPPSARQ